MQPVHRSLLEVNIASFLLGLVPLFVKAVPLGPVSLIFWRCLFGALALGGFLLIRRELRRLQGPQEYLAALAVAVLVTAHWVTYFHSIKVSTVAVALTAIFTYPALTVLIEPLIHRERPRPADLLLAGAALVGVALVVPGLSLGDSTVQGVLWGVFSALLFALRNVVYRRWLRRVSGGQIMLLQLLFVMVALVAFIEPVAEVAVDDWAWLVLLGVVFTAVAHSLFVGSMRHLTAKTVGLVACLQPVYGILAAALVLAEWPSLRTVAGALIVMAVAVVESVRAPQASPAAAGSD